MTECIPEKMLLLKEALLENGPGLTYTGCPTVGVPKVNLYKNSIFCA